VERILLTGGAGYIGSILAKALLDDGFEVVVLDNFMYRQNSLLDCCSNENFSVIRGDVRDEETLSNALDKADIIIHLAALVGAPLCDADPIAAKTTNLEATKLLLSLRSPSQKLLFPCTNSGYGIGQKDKFCTEETPLRPISLYGRTKVEAEKAIIQSGNFISYRLATVFGVSPRMRIDLLVNDFVYRAVNDHYLVIFEGKFKRNYIHINDVARVFLHGIKNFQSLKNQVYNVGISEANLSKIELCEKVKEHIPNFVYVESAIREDPDKRDYLISNEKIEKTGFRPKFSIDDGIVNLMKAYEVLKSRVYSNI
jgi:nucleoside-diphosphate-sugar epimerase